MPPIAPSSIVRGRLVGAFALWPGIVANITLYGPTGHALELAPVPVSDDGRFEVEIGASAPRAPTGITSLLTLRIRVVSGDEEIGAVGPIYRVRTPATIDVPIRTRPLFDRIEAAIRAEAGQLADVLPALFVRARPPSGASVIDPARAEHLARSIDLPVGAVRAFAETWRERESAPRGPDHETLFALRCPLPASTGGATDPADRVEAAIAANLVRERVTAHAHALRERRRREEKEGAQKEHERRVAELASRPGERRPSFADLLDIAGLASADEAVRRAIARVAVEGAPLPTAERLARLTRELGAARAEELALATALRRVDLAEHLASRLDVDAPLLGAILEATAHLDPAPDLADRHLAGLGRAGWAGVVAAALPQEKRAAAANAEIIAKARTLAEHFERAYPEEALIGALEMAGRKGTPDSRALVTDLRTLLSGRPEGTDPRRITSRWKNDAELRESVNAALEGRGPRVEALCADRIDAIRALERVLQVTPPSSAVSLVAAGYRSFRAIADRTPAELSDELARQAGHPPNSPEARAVSAEIERVHAIATRAALLTVAIATVPGVQAPPDRVEIGTLGGADAIGGEPKPSGRSAFGAAATPNYETFFGSPDACAVPEPLTALGTAAYLVDLLDFLRTAAPNAKLLDELRRRRPDVEGLHLSEANATTLLPAIDLVNERLESDLFPGATALQTTMTQAELSASPEHVSSDATSHLRAAAWPWTLPLDTRAVELDGWLGSLGWSSARAARLLSAADATASVAAAARADLGFSAAEWSLLRRGMRPTDADALPGVQPPGSLRVPRPAAGARSFHAGDVVRSTGDQPAGRKGSVWLVRSVLTGTTPELASARWDASDEDALGLLALLGIEIAELDALIASGFVQSAGAPELVRDANDPCDLSKARVKQLTPAVRERMVLLLRLRVRLGWPIADLDDALRLAGASAATELFRHGMDAAVLAQLAALARLRREGLSMAELAVLFPAAPSSEPAPQIMALLARTAGRSVAETAGLTALSAMEPLRSPVDLEQWLAASRLLRDNGLGPADLERLLRGNAGATGANDDDLRAVLSNTDPANPESAELAMARRVAIALKIRVEVARRLVERYPAGTTIDEPALKHMRQVTLLAQRLDLGGADVTLDAPGLSIFGVLRTADLATPDADAPALAVGSLLDACRMRGLRDRLLARGAQLDAVLGAASRGDPIDAWETVAATLSVDAADLLALRTRMELGHPRSIARRPLAWIALLDALDGLAATGVSAATFIGWAADAPDADAVHSARAAVRAKRGDAALIALGPAVADRVRTSRRDGLLALAGVKHTGTMEKEAAVDALAGRMLADPLVAATQQTTRIDFAVRAIQAFVQRLLLGTERDDKAGLALGAEAKERWRGLETFAIWRMNREIFLYPEMHLRPELRHDKSQLFSEIQRLVARRDPTDEHVEDAIVRYTGGLDEIARLEVMGACLEDPVSGEGVTLDLDAPPSFRMHVLARTHGSPHRHFLRALDGRTGRWEPWKPVDLDIDGEWAVPMIRRARLEIYWVRHARTLEGMKDVVGLIPATPFPLQPHLPMLQDQYTLSWAVRRRGEWGAKRTIDQPVSRPIFPFAQAQFAIREIGRSGERLRIAAVTPFVEPPAFPSMAGRSYPGGSQLAKWKRPPTKDELEAEARRRAEEAKRRAEEEARKAEEAAAEATRLAEEAAAEATRRAEEDEARLAEEAAARAEQEARRAEEAAAEATRLAEEAVAEAKRLAEEAAARAEQEARRAKEEGQRLVEAGATLATYAYELGKGAKESFESFIGVDPSELTDLLDVSRKLLEALQQLAEQLSMADPSWSVPHAIVKLKEMLSIVLIAIGDIGPLLTGLGANVRDWITRSSALFDWFQQRVEAVLGWLDRLEELTLADAVKTALQLGAGVLHESLRVLAEALATGLENGLPASGVTALVAAIKAFQPPKLAWCGPTLGVEFGFFDLGTESTRSVRLAPPNNPAGAAVIAGASTLPTVLAGAAAEGAMQALYTLFPGYPALFDLPVRTNLPEVHLPLLATARNAPSGAIPAWPGSGFLVAPLVPLGAAVIRVNVQRALEEDLPHIPTRSEVERAMTQGELAEAVMSAVTKLNELRDLPLDGLLQGIRWVRPLPFEPFPGRHSSPNPSFVTDERRGRTFLLWPTRGVSKTGVAVAWRVIHAYHPLARAMASTVERHGPDALFAAASEGESPASFSPQTNSFGHSFLVEGAFDGATAAEAIETHWRTAYGIYNWELLFHLPMLLGDRLRAARQYEKALVSYGRIFDPTAGSGEQVAQCFRFAHLRAACSPAWAGGPRAWVAELTSDTLSADQAGALVAWQERPFDPHAVAAFRESAYARAAFFRYVGTLLDWAEHLWAVDPKAHASQVTTLYLRARELMGRRPRKPSPSLGAAKSAGEVLSGGAAAAAAATLSLAEQAAAALAGPVFEGVSAASIAGPSFACFPLPVHPEVRGTWERIDLGLAKVRAWAGDLPAGAAIAGAKSKTTLPAGGPPQPPSTPSPQPLNPHRFSFLVQKALEQCAVAKAFSGELLSALASADGEALAQLRQKHELDLLAAGDRVRQLQEEDATLAVTAAEHAITGAEIRRSYYVSRQTLNEAEKVKEALSFAASVLQIHAGFADLQAAMLHMAPSFEFGVDVGAPKATGHGSLQWGSSFFANGASAFARGFSAFASIAHLGAEVAGAYAMYQRRKEEWDHQANLARSDLEHLRAQRDGASKRLEIARKERANHGLQKLLAGEVDDFLRDKATRKGLYEHMADRLLSRSFDLWWLALLTARQAERAWQFERLDDRTFVTGSGWNDDPQGRPLYGMTAAEALESELRWMEREWLEANLRDSPFERWIRLSQHDPVALIALRQTGRCVVDFPERLFDTDHPGDYLRRLREVRLSIPCVAGPSTPVNVRLELLAHSVRIKDDALPAYEDQGPTGAEPDMRFARWPAGPAGAGAPRFPDTPVKALSTSTAINASGQMDWYPRDERYVPFEGAGAVSTWQIELPHETNRFDFDTITDVVFELRYTARRGSEALRTAAWAATFDAAPPVPLAHVLPPPAQPQRRLLSVRTEAPDVWYAFRRAAGPEPTLTLRLSRDHFPHVGAGGSVKIDEIRLIALADAYDFAGATAALNIPDGALAPKSFDPWSGAHSEEVPGLRSATWSLATALPIEGDGVEITLSCNGLNVDALRDVLLLIAWTAG